MSANTSAFLSDKEQELITSVSSITKPAWIDDNPPSTLRVSWEKNTSRGHFDAYVNKAQKTAPASVEIQGQFRIRAPIPLCRSVLNDNTLVKHKQKFSDQVIDTVDFALLQKGYYLIRRSYRDSGGGVNWYLRLAADRSSVIVQEYEWNSMTIIRQILNSQFELDLDSDLEKELSKHTTLFCVAHLHTKRYFLPDNSMLDVSGQFIGGELHVIASITHHIKYAKDVYACIDDSATLTCSNLKIMLSLLQPYAYIAAYGGELPEINRACIETQTHKSEAFNILSPLLGLIEQQKQWLDAMADSYSD